MSKRILALFIIPIVAALCIIITLNLIDRNARLARSGIFYSDPAATNHWNSFDFTDFNPDNLLPLLRRIKIERSDMLGHFQTVQLLEKIKYFMLLNQTLDFEMFKKFRLEAPGRYDSESIKFFTKRLKEEGLPVPESDEAVLAQWFKTILSDYFRDGEKYWRQMATNGTKLAIGVAPPLPPPVEAIASRQPNAGVFLAKPVYIESVSPLELQRNHGKVLFATFITVVKNQKQVPCPVYLQLFWDPNREHWIPWKLATGGSPGFHPAEF